MNKMVWVVLLTGLAACEAKKSGTEFSVDGTIKNSTAKMVYLQESPAGSAPVIVDSAQLEKNGAFSLATTGKEESIYSLRTNDAPYPFAILINDTKNAKVNADLMNMNQPYSVSGSPASQGLLDYDRNAMARAQQIYDLSRQIDSAQKSGATDTALAQPFSRYESSAQELKTYTHSFVRDASSPMLALYALGNYQRLTEQLGLRPFSSTEQRELIDALAGRFPQNLALQDLKKKQRSAEAPDFTMADTSGQNVTLSSFRGKYVLVDFWASWCGPCRNENPNVVKAFNKYKDKNFTILGVSLDKDRGAWLKAIKQDNLSWTHVSDLQFWNNAAATLYNVRSIPYNVLLNPKGEIVGESLTGADLERTLAKVLQ